MVVQALVIDDDEALCETIAQALAGHGIDVTWRTRAEDAFQIFEAQQPIDVVVTDINLGSMDGLTFCRQTTDLFPELPVIIITAFGSMKTAVGALRAGAYDFVNKPVQMETLSHAIHKAAEHRALYDEVHRLREVVENYRPNGGLVGESAPMKRLENLIRRVADTDSPILIMGESGTGKELVARSLHENSARRHATFVGINCAAVPETLLESELFGHAKGAFTGAQRSRKGLFMQADGGTILLDEIGDMPAEMQAKLLRVLQDQRVRPVGDEEEFTFDARIVAATNRDLEEDVEQGRFREDLFYRLNVVQLELPPLRARGNDILLLAQHFLHQAAGKQGREIRGISAEAATKLLDYDWPGNVRQLANCMERAVTLAQHDEIMPQDLPAKVRDHESARFVLVERDVEHLLPMAELEKRYIAKVLDAVDGNKTRAARILGLDRRTLYRKLDRYSEQDAAQ